MSTTTDVRVETLVAVDWDGAGLSPQRVLDFVGDALVDHEVTTRPHWRTGAPLVTHLVRFDARRVRNTEVHGVSFHSGFVSHVE